MADQANEGILSPFLRKRRIKAFLSHIQTRGEGAGSRVWITVAVQTLSPRISRQVAALIILVVIGSLLRYSACFWGYPLQLHPDEPAIVTQSIDLITRNSYEPRVYNRPDHFEIKLCAVIFQIFSYIKYNVSAEIAFKTHAIDFYVLARMVSSLFGILLIILCYVYMDKINSHASLVGATLAAFYPIFITHSAYATPDITLTFFILLISYLTLLYINSADKKYLWSLSIITGIGVTIKYTCAFACLWIAFLIIYINIKNRQYFKVLKDGVIAFFIVAGSCFFCAPNLFTNFNKTITTVIFEARSTHLGADGLSFIGNLKFYLDSFLYACGYESLLALVA